MIMQAISLLSSVLSPVVSVLKHHCQMSAQQPQPLPQMAENPRMRRRLLMLGVPDVTPLLDLSHSLSNSSSSSFTTANLSFDSRSEGSSSQYHQAIVQHTRRWSPFKTFGIFSAAGAILRSLFPSLGAFLIPTCSWMKVPQVMIPTSASPTRRKLIGTFFGHKRGRVCFTVQEDPRSDPVLLLELAIPTSHLVKEMASGMVRILLECERTKTAAAATTKKKHPRQRPLWEEPVWTVYCNGQKRGYAVSRLPTEEDFHVLSSVQTVSVGAGLLPGGSFKAPALSLPLEREESLKDVEGWVVEGGRGGGPDVMYMRAKFERVVGGRDSEAFYMISPDCGKGKSYDNGGPELSIFLLRV